MTTRLLLFCLLITNAALAQKTDTVLLKQLLQSHPELFSGILNHPAKNEIQILYTQINRDERNNPHFTTYSYRLNPHHYFYPASTVKLPTAIFTLEKINALRLKKLKTADMLTDSAFKGQSRVLSDTLSKTGLPSIENYIKKILLVSDNDAYNRLYEFTGREEINKNLKKYGLLNTRIVSRLAVGDRGESARNTNPVNFYSSNKLIYTKKSLRDTNDYPMQLENMIQGKGHLDNKDSLVMTPFDFSSMNIYPLADQQMVIRRLLFPEAFTKDQRYNLTAGDYKLIYRYMSMFPTESNKPTYNRPEYYPAYCKFLYYGADSLATINPNVRIFNKVGDSYGYDIDNAYIIDFSTKVEFMLSAVVQSNEDGILNDDKYEYKTVCLPFLKNLGQVIMQYEQKRAKKFLPNLDKFRMSYTE
ncbi:hypothetical protein A0256_17085 [Mucilaginibacter sp. PAMC 26640]|nr:hypothetical protein A0256_17085 [Mucilaginibacter sp. PAMC 26640]